MRIYLFYLRSHGYVEFVMNRKGQLRNVAFGGAWADQIPKREELINALLELEHAVEESVESDLRTWPDVWRALSAVCEAHPKGAILKRTWTRALANPSQQERYVELRRIVYILKAWVGPM